MNPSYLAASLLLVSMDNSPTFPLFALYFAIATISHFSLSGFLLEKKVGVNQPKRLEDARILIANTAMDTDKIKVCVSEVEGGGELKVSRYCFFIGRCLGPKFVWTPLQR